MEDKDKLLIVKERIAKEGLTGDQAQAARKAGVTPTVVTTALKKERWDVLTKKERKAAMSLLRVLDERKEQEAEFEARIHESN